MKILYGFIGLGAILLIAGIGLIGYSYYQNSSSPDGVDDFSVDSLGNYLTIASCEAAGREQESNGQYTNCKCNEITPTGGNTVGFQYQLNCDRRTSPPPHLNPVPPTEPPPTTQLCGSDGRSNCSERNVGSCSNGQQRITCYSNVNNSIGCYDRYVSCGGSNPPPTNPPAGNPPPAVAPPTNQSSSSANSSDGSGGGDDSSSEIGSGATSSSGSGGSGVSSLPDTAFEFGDNLAYLLFGLSLIGFGFLYNRVQSILR